MPDTPLVLTFHKLALWDSHDMANISRVHNAGGSEVRIDCWEIEDGRDEGIQNFTEYNIFFWADAASRHGAIEVII